MERSARHRALPEIGPAVAPTFLAGRVSFFVRGMISLAAGPLAGKGASHAT